MKSGQPDPPFELHIVSAQAELFNGPIERVILPAEHGELCLLPGHAPLLARLRPGEVRYHDENGWTYLFLEGGFVEAQPHEVTVLADTVLRAEEIDAEAAAQAVRTARDHVRRARLPHDQQLAEVELLRALALLHIADRVRAHRRRV